MPRYLLTNEVITTGLWKLLITNPSYSEDLTTKAKPGKSAACTYFRFIPGTLNSTAGNFLDVSKISTLTLATGEDYVTSMIASGNYLYAGVSYTQFQIVKVDLTTFTRVSALIPDVILGCISSMVVSDNYLYAGMLIAPGKIVKIDLTTFTQVSYLLLGTDEPYITSLAVSGNYLYAGLNTSPAKIVKIDLTTFSKVSTLTLDAGENYATSLAVSGNYLYVGLNTSPAKIVKIDLATFTKVSTLTLASDENNLSALIVSGNYLYAGLRTSPAKIVKIDLTTFSKVSTLTLATGEDYATSLAVCGRSLYVGLDLSPAKIVRIDLTTFSKVLTLTLATGEDYVTSMVADKYLYVGLKTVPGKIAKVGYPASGWMTETPLKCTFQSGNWTFKIRLVNDTKYSFAVRVAVRLLINFLDVITVSESPNSLTLPATAGASVYDTWTWSAPEVSFNNEHLVAEYRIHIVTAGGSTSCQCSFACDENPAVREESITTPEMIIPVVETIVAQEYPMLYYAKTPQELRSKVSGVTITTIAKDFPEALLKKGKAQELRSKWA